MDLLFFAGLIFLATYLVVDTYACPKAYLAYGIGVVIGLAWGYLCRLRAKAVRRQKASKKPLQFLKGLVLAILLVILFQGTLSYLESLPLPCELEAAVPALLGSTLGAWILYNSCFFLWVKITGEKR